jgi:hypothetical protein
MTLKNGIKELPHIKLILFMNGYVLIQFNFVVRRAHLDQIVDDVIVGITRKFVQAMEIVM